MGPVEINGLPAHVLIVHLVVVLIPTAAVCVVLSAWWPRARRWLGVLTPIAALAGLALVPVTTNAGHWLADQLGAAPLIARHEELGDQMLWWAIGLFVVAAGQWAWHRRGTGEASAGRTAVTGVVIGVVATAVAVGSVVHIVRVGDSGSRAVWEGSYSSSR